MEDKKMKIKPEHYSHMKTEIDRVCFVYAEEIPKHIAQVKQLGRYHDLKKRIRWDMFNTAQLTSFACDTLYDYLNDEHIDTALRSIMTDKEFYKNLD